MVYFVIAVAAVCLAVAACILTESSRETKDFVVTRYTVCSDKVVGEVRFAVLADLHNSEYGEGNARLLRAVDDASPDFVLTAGDMIVGKPGVSVSTAVSLLNELGRRYPVYAAKGNHEMRVSIYDSYGDMWERLYGDTSANVNWLINDSGDLPGCNVTVYGLDIRPEYYRRFKKRRMDDSYLINELPERNPDKFNILLGHNPDYFEEYARWGADMVLSGHVHGGLIIIPHVGGLLSPMVRFFPKYYRGMYSCGKSRMIVSAGLGQHTFKLRVNNRPELIILNVKSTLS